MTTLLKVGPEKPVLVNLPSAIPQWRIIVTAMRSHVIVAAMRSHVIVTAMRSHLIELVQVHFAMMFAMMMVALLVP